MQYILSQEEYDDLQESCKERGAKYNKHLQELCTKAADSIVLKSGWRKGQPWGCILTHDDWYCDECPAQDVCPLKGKKWSQ